MFDRGTLTAFLVQAGIEPVALTTEQESTSKLYELFSQLKQYLLTFEHYSMHLNKFKHLLSVPKLYN